MIAVKDDQIQSQGRCWMTVLPIEVTAVAKIYEGTMDLSKKLRIEILTSIVVLKAFKIRIVNVFAAFGNPGSKITGTAGLVCSLHLAILRSQTTIPIEPHACTISDTNYSLLDWTSFSAEEFNIRESPRACD